jgi:acyl dehydratase
MTLTPPSVGAELPIVELGPITPVFLAGYAAASGDHNPLHTDPAFARAAGLDDVIAHGMIVMGLLGRLVDTLAGPGATHDFSASFKAMTRLGETLRAGGQITALRHRDGHTYLSAELWARGDDDQLKATAIVSVALSGY